MIHNRIIFPVGQGGFAYERIENYVVIYDCGSHSSMSRVESFIDDVSMRIDHVDLLFISHFDKDHVSGLRYLLSHLRVRTAVVPWIASELKMAYGMYTNGSYSAIESILRENDVEVVEIREEGNEQHQFTFQDLWEWVAKSMMTAADFESVKLYMQKLGLDLTALTSDVVYLEKEKDNINAAFKAVFGAKGPNTKGLVMLSQRCKNSPLRAKIMMRGCPHCMGFFQLIDYIDKTSCLYVGDADLKNRGCKRMVQNFLIRYKCDEPLLMMQIPHHGSQYNIGVNFEKDFPSLFYFVNDIDTKRLQKSACLFKSLTKQKKLLVSRDVCHDTIVTKAGV